MQERFEKLVQKVIEKTPAGQLIYGYELARSLSFAVQSLTLSAWEVAWTGSSKRLNQKGAAKNISDAFADMQELLKKDSENIRKGLYPWTVLKPRPLHKNLLLYPKVILDGFGISKRRQAKKNQDFNPEAQEFLDEVPEYYRRNFHFQTGGYFTEGSAALYDYQVEMLFSGAGDAMRRLLLPRLRAHFSSSIQGEGLHFLEVASGTGRLSSFVKTIFPKARITLLDLSDAYLKKAREELSGLSRLDFMHGDAANLPFAEEKFDAVYSCFLFHELPFEIRKKVLAQGFRVLKPGGFYGFVDALQMGDKPAFDWALKQFPLDFHEPFFKNYADRPLEPLLEKAGLELTSTEFGFFSKCVGAQKPRSS